ncbi:unnamed protein product [Closterium sp. NIES-53]
MFEHLHGLLVKRIYRRSNKRNVDGQIMKFHARRIPDVVPVDDPADRDTAMRQTDTRTLIKESYFLPVELPQEPTSTNWFARKPMHRWQSLQQTTPASQEFLTSFEQPLTILRGHGTRMLQWRV